jgi:hypothetical protein
MTRSSAPEVAQASHTCVIGSGRVGATLRQAAPRQTLARDGGTRGICNARRGEAEMIFAETTRRAQSQARARHVKVAARLRCPEVLGVRLEPVAACHRRRKEDGGQRVAKRRRRAVGPSSPGTAPFLFLRHDSSTASRVNTEAGFRFRMNERAGLRGH